jgi:plasmid stability protein
MISMLSSGQMGSGTKTMANLLVRNVEAEVVEALKARSGKHGVSAEEEHRRILRAALLKPRKKSFAEALLAIPDVGEDRDFQRVQVNERRHVFD